jgi:hypothetical protein
MFAYVSAWLLRVFSSPRQDGQFDRWLCAVQFQLELHSLDRRRRCSLFDEQDENMRARKIEELDDAIDYYTCLLRETKYAHLVATLSVEQLQCWRSLELDAQLMSAIGKEKRDDSVGMNKLF